MQIPSPREDELFYKDTGQVQNMRRSSAGIVLEALANRTEDEPEAPW